MRLLDTSFRRLRAEREKHVAARDQANAEIEAIDRRLAEAIHILGVFDEFAEGSASAEDKTSKVRPKREGTLTHFIFAAVEKAEFGLSRREVTELVRGSQFAEQARQNPNGVYNVVSRAVIAGRLKEESGRLYGADAKIVLPPVTAAADPPPRVPGRSIVAPSFREEIFSIIAERGPTKAAEIVAELFKRPAFGSRLDGTGSLAYAHLSKMFRRGDLIKVGDAYEIPNRAGASIGNVVSLSSPRREPIM